MKKYEIIAVDFDGTLCSDCYPDIGKPNLPLIELLKALKNERAAGSFSGPAGVAGN